MTHERTRFKINYSYGIILRNVETDQLRYFYGSLGNARMLGFAVLISNQDDLRSFLETICDFRHAGENRATRHQMGSGDNYQHNIFCQLIT